jgi:hypothetical protein
MLDIYATSRVYLLLLLGYMLRLDIQLMDMGSGWHRCGGYYVKYFQYRSGSILALEKYQLWELRFCVIRLH